MRPNLSFEKIAGALAVLGTGVILAACGGEEPKTPVNASEVSGAPTEGAEKKAMDAKPADPVAPAMPATPAAPAASAAPMDTKPAMPATDTKAMDTKGMPAPATSGSAKKPATPAMPGKKGGAGSCGAGTCSAKK